MRRRMIGVAAALLAALAWWLAAMFWMPGASARGRSEPLTAHESALADALRRDVTALGGEIGERNFQQYDALLAAADYIDHALTASGYEVRRQRYEVDGRPFDNLEVERRGTSKPEEIVLVGAHYDSVVGAPGANDNGTGVAAALALAEAFAGRTTARTVRFVAFVNEEPPFAHTPSMGSVVYATRSRQRGERITAMLSLETMGYFADAPGSQQYPSVLRWVYPDTANFITFVSNLSSRGELKRAIKSFRHVASIPSEGGALPATISGVGWSDHWSFWQAGFPAIMVTDTALFRYPAYHTPNDTPEQVDYERLARVVAGLEHVVADLAA
ncbi:MAG TPA: M28 family peptidase [Nitrospiria bacterium]|nr:M28 family peptidase [Nitrospiria bacterium]